VPVIDIDEARFAQATRQMIESGDYVTHPAPGRRAQSLKPAGIYWLQAASVHAVRSVRRRGINTIWPYRMPSVLGLDARGVGRTLGRAQRSHRPAHRHLSALGSIRRRVARGP
jgi:hypothetical protein